MPLKMLSDSTVSMQIIGVLSGKGGVGKSTATVNLALALSRMGKKVGVLDADIYGPSIRKMVKADTFPSEKDGKIVPATGQGITFLSLAFFQKEGEAAIVRAPIANQMIQQFLDRVIWGDLDYLLIDFPPGTGDIQITLMQQASLTGAVVVTTPQEVALLDVRKAIYMNKELEVPTLGVIENMSYFTLPDTKERHALFGEGGGKALSEEFQIPLLGEIPIDPLLSQCGDEGRSLFETEAPSRFAFEEIANKLEHKLSLLAEAVKIKQTREIDPHHFTAVWSDGLETTYRYSELEKLCPCVRCQSIQKEENKTLTAKQITQVGRYALSFAFESGCSKGIYPFSLLREMAEAHR